MVEDERTLLGTLKALGFLNKEIVFKYIFYALTASALGGAGTGSVGGWGFSGSGFWGSGCGCFTSGFSGSGQRRRS